VATKTPALPSSDELQLFDYKIGSFGSDLDSLRSTLERCSTIIPLEEYLQQRALGIEFDASATDFDRDELARVAVYATDWLRDLAQIAEDAKKIQEEAVTLYHEQSPNSLRDPEGWDRYKATVRGWHEAAILGNAVA
jgi:hypothetical protein